MPAAYVALLAATLVWLHRVSVIFADTGLFRVLGIDWALYDSQSLLVRAGQPRRCDPGSLDATLQTFRSVHNRSV